ncbi:LysM peptidoglycan-binding domain-containing protein [Kribbella sp. CA-253562]|uniref:LysM peptidoglycan-binding domain-containing protein n=1 Tax=Kribbella sp. CA-253562 TaxID=3239942 RepID=UPI003D8F409E
MIRGLKTLIALGGLAAAGFLLRWVTAGTIAEASSQDLISMAFVAVAAVAWTAYGWLVLAVVATVLEQAPGVLGRAGAAVAGRITSSTSRALLRSALGVAAVAPLTIGVAHASPANPPQHSDSATSSGTNWRATEPASTIRLDEPISPNDWRLTEKPSTIRLTGQSGTERTSRPQFEPKSKAEIGRPVEDRTHRATASRSAEETGRPAEHPARPGEQHAARPVQQHRARPVEQQPARPVEQQGPGDTGRPGAKDAGRLGDPVAPRSGHTTGDPATARPGDATGRVGAKDTGRLGDPVAPESGRTVGDPMAPKPGHTAGDPVAPKPGHTAGDPAAPKPGDTTKRPGIRVPDRPTDGAPVRYTDLGSGQHVVLRGESLWSIAAAELGPGASESAIAARWPQWYAANRAVIGPDPDLLRPGQVLQAPASLDRPVPQTPQEK